MKPKIPFPSRGGDWRYDVKTGQMVDASLPQAIDVPPDGTWSPTIQGDAPSPQPKPARNGKRAK